MNDRGEILDSIITAFNLSKEGQKLDQANKIVDPVIMAFNRFVAFNCFRGEFTKESTNKSLQKNKGHT